MALYLYFLIFVWGEGRGKRGEGRGERFLFFLKSNRYVKKILDIPVLTRGGAKQLDTDIGIFILIFFHF